MTPNEYARREVGDALYQLLMARPGPTPSPLLVHALPARLGVGPAAAREVLQSDKRFIVVDGKYDLKAREALRRLNFDQAVEYVGVDLGRPVPQRLLAQLLASVTSRDADYYEQLMERLAAAGKLHIADADIVPTSWFFLPEGETEEDVLFYCGLENNEELERLRPVLAQEDLQDASPADTAARIVATAGCAVSNLAVGFFTWRLHPDEYDAQELLSLMLVDERVYPGPGLMWVPGYVREQVREALQILDQEAAERRPGLLIDLDDLLSEPLPPDHPGYFIRDEDLTLLYEIVHGSPSPVTVLDLVEDVIGLHPGDPDFLAAAHSVRTLLRDDPEVAELGPTTFAGRTAMEQGT